MEQELDDCNIFVKYLPADLNDQGLRDLFSMYGSIVSAKVMIDQKKGTSLGYGYLYYLLTLFHKKFKKIKQF